MKKKTFIIVSLTILIISTIWLYIHKTYFFNPLTFKRDEITYLPFNWYKNDMIYFYYGVDGKYNEVKSNSIRNNEDINLIYNELKKGKILGSVFSNKLNIGIPQMNFIINSGANKEMTEIDCTVTHITWFGDESEVCTVSGIEKKAKKTMTTELYVEMTPRLKEFFLSKANLK